MTTGNTMDLNDLLNADEDTEVVKEDEVVEEVTEVEAEMVEPAESDGSELTEPVEEVTEVTVEEVSEPPEPEESVEVRESTSTVEIKDTVKVSDSVEVTVEDTGVETPEVTLEVEESTEVETAPEIVEPEGLPDGMVTAFDFLSANADKVVNCNSFEIGIPTIQKGKYMMYFDKEGDDPDLYMINNTNRLAFASFDPSEIKVVGSGIIAVSDNCELFINQTNVIQFVMDDGVPQTCTTFKKMNVKSDAPKSDIEEKAENASSLDQTKLYVRQASPKLHAQIAEMTEVSDIKAKTIEFKGTIVDINHLLKLNKMLMSCGF